MVHDALGYKSDCDAELEQSFTIFYPSGRIRAAVPTW
jgi:hypothetical protein